MKILTKIAYILLVAALLVGCLPLGAVAEESADEPAEVEPDVYGTDDFEYTVDEQLQVTITDYNGSANAIAIPEVLGGYPVVAIADDVFSNHDEIISVIFSEGLKSIGEYAFADCSSLKAIILPNTLERIGSNAFEGCSALYHADLGTSLVSIGGGAFSGCSALDSVSLPHSVTKIEDKAFAECDRLQEVFLESTQASVATNAFESSPLVTVYAYAGAAVHTAGGDYRRAVAAGAEALVFDDFAGGLTVVDVIGEPQAIIIPHRADNNIVALGSYALAKLTSLKAVHLPDTVINIDKTAFKDDTALTFVRLPRWVQASPGQEMFYGCTSLRRVYLPEGMETVGMKNFFGCTSLQVVTFPSDLVRIKSGAFSGCSALSELYFLGGVPECAMTGGAAESVVMNSAPADMKVFASSRLGWSQSWQPNGGSPYLTYGVTLCDYDCFYIETIITPLSCAEDGVSHLVCPHCNDAFERIYPKYEHNFVSVGMGNGVESFRCTGCTENYTVGRLEIVEINAQVDHVYSGAEMIRNVTVTYRGTLLTEGVDYTLNIEHSSQTNRLIITVTGMGEYAGSRRAAYSSLTGNKLTPYTLTVIGGTGSGEYFRDDIVEIYPNEPIPQGREAVWTVVGATLRQGDNQKAVLQMPTHDVTVTLGTRQAAVTQPPVEDTRPPEDSRPADTTPPVEDTQPPEDSQPADTDPPFGSTDTARDFMSRAVLFGGILAVSFVGFVVMCVYMFKKDFKKTK